MLARSIWGAVGGGSAGALYGAFGRCAGGLCHAEWNALVPTVAGAIVGLVVVRASRWD